jgi:hypothetical protein
VTAQQVWLMIADIITLVVMFIGIHLASAAVIASRVASVQLSTTIYMCVTGSIGAFHVEHKGRPPYKIRNGADAFGQLAQLGPQFGNSEDNCEYFLSGG